MTSRSPLIPRLAAASATAVALAAAAAAQADGRFSWFDAPAGSGSAEGLTAPRPVAFGFEIYRGASHSRWFADERYAAFGEEEEGRAQTDRVRIYGQWRLEDGRAGVRTAYDLLSPSLDPGVSPRSQLGVSWEHRLDALNRVTLSAEYGKYRFARQGPDEAGVHDTLDTRAVLSWTGSFAGYGHASLTSSVYLGGETAPDPASAAAGPGRTYYGLALGGKLNLFESHTPYLSFRLQRSDYDPADPVASARLDYQTLVSAGWKWQVHRGLSLQAEASYGYRGERLDLLAPERSHLFFGTRFDFR